MQSINIISNDNWYICFRNLVRVVKYRLCLNSPHGVIGQGNLVVPLATSSTWDRHRQHFPMSSRSIQHKYSQNKHPTVATKQTWQRVKSTQKLGPYSCYKAKAKAKPTQKLAPYSCHKAIAKVRPTQKLIPYSCYKAKAKAKPVQCKNAKISSQQLLQEQNLRCEPFDSMSQNEPLGLKSCLYTQVF